MSLIYAYILPHFSIRPVAFFEKMNYFGYDKNYITFFMQEMAPAANYNGKVYMEDKGKLATSPNGNGGWFSSMQNAGLVDLIHEKGIEWINVFAVDNVLQRIADPCFIGATIKRNCTVGAKVVRKADPDEKVGVMCLEDGRPSIVEKATICPPQSFMGAIDDDRRNVLIETSELYGKYEEAILAFDKAIKIEEKSTEARVYLAQGYVGNNEPDKAIEVLKEETLKGSEEDCLRILKRIFMETN